MNRTAALLIFSLGAVCGSRGEIGMQQAELFPRVCVAQQGPTYFDSGELSREEAEEVRKVVKGKK